MSPTLELIRSAFGPKTTLYDALDSPKNANQADLKRAYRKAALKYHPDKQKRSLSNSNDSLIMKATTKFQAVSAAYEVLMNAKWRSIYDATGRVVENEELNNEEGKCNSSPSYDKKYRRSNRRNDHEPNEQRQRRWDDFFHSVFNDIISAESRYGDADSYRSSIQEKEDILKYYRMCKGDFQMVLNCVVHGTEKDVERWMKDIITPAIVRGDIEDFGGTLDFKSNNTDTVDSLTRDQGISALVDSDEDSDDCGLETETKKKHRIGSINKKRLKKYGDKNHKRTKHSKGSKVTKSRANVLKDSDEESEDDCISRSGITMPLSMNRRDKMEYRVAKKRKLKVKREIEISNIIKSKNWTSGVTTETPIGQWEHRERPGTFSDVLLSNMEKKYSKDSNNRGRRKIRQKK